MLINKLVDIWCYIKTAISLTNFTITNIDQTTGIISYVCNNKIYKTMSWPIGRKAGVALPIKEARFVPADGTPAFDVTDLVKTWAGPRSDFYGQEPDVAAMFNRREIKWGLPKITWRLRPGIRFVFEWLTDAYYVKAPNGELRVTNIGGHESIFAAK